MMLWTFCILLHMRNCAKKKSDELIEIRPGSIFAYIFIKFSTKKKVTTRSKSVYTGSP